MSLTQKETQRKGILEYMQKHGHITPIEALEQFGCFRLSARIWELRKAGYIIKTTSHKKSGKRFAVYHLKGHKTNGLSNK